MTLCSFAVVIVLLLETKCIQAIAARYEHILDTIQHVGDWGVANLVSEA